MKKLIELMEENLREAFVTAGYDEKYAKVTLSNRPDLCEYQCNGAMAAAKAYHKAPFVIAEEVVKAIGNTEMFAGIEVVKPGFINIILNPQFLSDFINQMKKVPKLGCRTEQPPKKIIIDFGGANVAKPLHVGHLRSAVIGESIKRMLRYLGNDVIGDVHLGDWGLQMGLIITELKERKPELIYFDEQYQGEYPKEPPFTISELEEIYPCANAKSKEDEDFKNRAHEATLMLQKGYPPYRALWRHILNVSVEDLKKNYGNLKVSFDWWKGESDADPYIPEMIGMLEKKSLLHQSEGAMVVDVQLESDTKEVPPCIIKKSDGAALYATSDLATLVQREQDVRPDHVVYVVDKRQEMHFTQVFRVAKKAGIVREETDLTFIGFGTMNGKDGKPFKTRDGGVMRLEYLIADISEAVYQKMMENRSIEEEEARKTARIIGLAALKYGDLSNQATKDYIFDVDRFASFEGNTGPYILYTIVRIKSILHKYEEEKGLLADETADSIADELYQKVDILAAAGDSEKELMLVLAKYNDVIETAVADLAPHKICAYVYELANSFNKFYHETKILGCGDEERKKSYIALISLAKKALEDCIDLLGFEAPERM